MEDAVELSHASRVFCTSEPVSVKTHRGAFLSGRNVIARAHST
jgi:hypothetical protein